MLRDIELVNDIRILYNSSIIIYGAGEKGKKVFHLIEDNNVNDKMTLCAFCDHDINKWHSIFEQLEVISLNEVKKRNYNKVFFLVCIEKINEFEILLKENDFECNYASWWSVCLSISKNYCGLENLNIRKMELDNYILKRKMYDIALDYFYQFYLCNDDTVWVLQPGKTASSSLELRLQNIGVPYFKEHFLDYPEHILGERFRDDWNSLIKKKVKNNIKIISAVRNPFDRDYSAFWQAFTENLERIKLMPIFQQSTTMQEMYNCFMKYILYGYHYTKDELSDSMPYTWIDEFEWFDYQIRDILEIDIYAYPFDREQGYTIINKGDISIFLFKVEKINEINDKMAEFLEVDDIPQINANIASEKWYYAAYNDFKNKVKFNTKYIEHYLDNNKKVQHFYSDKELCEFAKKWKRAID